MGYRGNLGCLWLALALLVVGGTPLLIGVLRVFFFFIALLVVGGAALSWWIRRQAVRAYTETHGPRHNRFVELLVGLLMRLAEIDGTLSRAEVTAVRTFFEQRLGDRVRIVVVIEHRALTREQALPRAHPRKGPHVLPRQRLFQGKIHVLHDIRCREIGPE